MWFNKFVFKLVSGGYFVFHSRQHIFREYTGAIVMFIYWHQSNKKVL